MTSFYGPNAVRLSEIGRAGSSRGALAQGALAPASTLDWTGRSTGESFGAATQQRAATAFEGVGSALGAFGVPFGGAIGSGLGALVRMF